MKSLHSFLVNNRVQNNIHDVEIKLQDLKEDDHFAIDYHAAGKPNKNYRMIGVVSSIDFKYETMPITAKYIAYLYSDDEPASKPVYVNTDVALPDKYVLRTPTEEEEKLLGEIEPCYDIHISDCDEEIGYIENMKFIEY